MTGGDRPGEGDVLTADGRRFGGGGGAVGVGGGGDLGGGNEEFLCYHL